MKLTKETMDRMDKGQSANELLPEPVHACIYIYFVGLGLINKSFFDLSEAN